MLYLADFIYAILLSRILIEDFQGFFLCKTSIDSNFNIYINENLIIKNYFIFAFKAKSNASRKMFTFKTNHYHCRRYYNSDNLHPNITNLYTPQYFYQLQICWTFECPFSHFHVTIFTYLLLSLIPYLDLKIHPPLPKKPLKITYNGNFKLAIVQGSVIGEQNIRQRLVGL